MLFTVIVQFEKLTAAKINFEVVTKFHSVGLLNFVCKLTIVALFSCWLTFERFS